MFDELASFLGLLNSLTPLGVIGLLGTIILLLVHKKGPLQTLKNNHLEHVQESLDKLVNSGEKQVDLLVDISRDMNYVKGKLDK